MFPQNQSFILTLAEIPKHIFFESQLFSSNIYSNLQSIMHTLFMNKIYCSDHQVTLKLSIFSFIQKQMQVINTFCKFNWSCSIQLITAVWALKEFLYLLKAKVEYQYEKLYISS